ncbi:hypothetical protein N7495_006832 [Penicillium taxi]|uniref:uncharacterized protein n=1 Tax=Penicillium taxi TaxID=168475 RepID=UPI0025453BE4|nr:uncharacterized protein N7495_006832 [Penicillium taxi]KAJ5895141.1 hypothetical protein N7495_006832 [Penicillium taxi]
MQYFITHSRWGHDYDIAVGNTSAYHVVNSQMIPGKPDLTFYSGSNKASPIIGVCRYRHFSSDMEIGLGDPNNPHTVNWEQLNRKGVVKTRYSFRVNLGSRSPRTFTWKESTGQGHTNFKLVDERTNQVVALFSSGNTFSTEDGQLDILVEYSPRFSLLVLLTFLGLYEKMRRFKRGQKQPLMLPLGVES